MIPTPERLNSALIRLSIRYVFRHSWQSLLMILGIALGVAVMVSIDLANSSASRAFELSAEAVTGRATHQVIASTNGIDESIYVRLRREGLEVPMAPVVSAFVRSSDLGEQPYQVLGIDPFVDRDFRDYWQDAGGQNDRLLLEFLTQPGTVMLSQSVADRYQLVEGQSFSLEVDGRRQQVVLGGMILPSDRLAARSLEGIILADIATAQEISGKIGRIDRIDLILTGEKSEAVNAVERLLPAGARLETVEARQGAIEEMTAAFQLNLSALSLLALVVGLFLIYNTMTFSVVQRRDLFGVLRCLGVTRGQVFSLVAVEAIIVGVIGSLTGIGLGILLGRGTVGMVSQTINDLYFTTTVRDVGLPLVSLVKGGVLGLLATLAAAIPPALEAASVEPNAALSRSGLESKARAVVWLLALSGLMLGGLGVLLFRIPFGGITSAFSGTFLVVVGLAMTAAVLMRAVISGITPLSAGLFGYIGRMAPRNLVNALSRTAVAVAALMVAVAVTIGVSLMIDSFRYTVSVWLEETLQSDIYISAPSFTANVSFTPLEPELIAALTKYDQIERIDSLRSTMVLSDRGEVQISASNNPDLVRERIFKSPVGNLDQLAARFASGDILLSEPLANRLEIEVGDQLTLYTPTGDRSVRVAGIFYDYASSEGNLLLDLKIYRQLYQDPSVTAIGIRLKPGEDADNLVRVLRTDLQGGQELNIRANAALRADVMEIFDRTFAITAALRILATVVAFIGILSTMLLLQLDKQREIGILKALGLTGRELWGLVMLETGLMGLVAGLLAAPTGYVLSLILIYVINLRSFGWTLQQAVRPEVFIFAMLLAVGAALLAGVIPAIRLGRMPAAEAIRYE